MVKLTRSPSAMLDPSRVVTNLWAMKTDKVSAYSITSHLMTYIHAHTIPHGFRQDLTPTIRPH